MSVDVELVLRAVLREYELPWYDIHGLAHWGRVLDNGLRVAESTGADEDVVTLFALFHDSQRINEGSDPGHGRRGAELAKYLRGTVFDVDDGQAALLYEACTLHTDGLTAGDVTVMTCWDADRLDLPRVGITPNPDRLCTEFARDCAVIAWAQERAEGDRVSERIRGVYDELRAEIDGPTSRRRGTRLFGRDRRRR